ncbi:MAG TPA: amidophosphoribosyltransferase [Candidatus Saccharimonadales bacterium]|nr:amidophosphoribosyltransferase [Candidatus Saccharimonadales bacterium]
MSGELKEECAVAAVSIPNTLEKHPEGGAAFYLYQMLLRMQNRGQLAAGITTYNPNRMQLIDTHKRVGTVNEVFATNSKPQAEAIMERYSGTKGIGHTRYSTSGGDDEGSAQPFERHHGRKWKWFSFAFNGNIANFTDLKLELEKEHYQLVRNLDTEVMLHYLEKSQIGDKKTPMQEVFASLSEKFDGAYNIAYIDAEGTLTVMRDPLGIRPMSYTIGDEFSGAASESVALSNFAVSEIKDLKPGEMFISNGEGTEIKRFAKSPGNAHCMFEYVYFSNAATVLDGKSVYETRWNLGAELARQETLKVNDRDFVVVPVPDTAKPAADAYAHTIGLPEMEGLIRNRYVGRTFIWSGDRMEKVKQKYYINTAAIKGKKVILVDDSIARGNTSRFLIQYLREAGGAAEIHMRITCPPVRSPCFYGIDMSTIGELIANRHSNREQLRQTGWIDIDDEVVQKIGKEIGVESLRFMSIEGLVKSIGLPNGKKDLCAACITGEYPTEWGAKLRLDAIERYERGLEGKRTYE